MDSPSIGRIVHYVTLSGEHRPAIITKIIRNDIVNLNVFADASDAGEGKVSGTMGDIWKGDGPRPNDVPGTWHWPERV